MTFLERRFELEIGSLETVEVAYDVCRFCGLVGKNPLPKETELAAYYANAWQAKSARPKACYDAAASWIFHALRPLDIFSFDGLLDVGSADLSMARALQEKFSIAKVVAIDPQPRDSGVEVLASETLGGHALQRADLVVATHVLEHVHTPGVFVDTLFAALGSAGFVYIEVPALEGGRFFCSDNVNRAHLWHFSLNALLRLCVPRNVSHDPHGVASVIAAETDRSLLGWPVNRILLRKQDKEASISGGDYRRFWGRMMNAQDDDYTKAVRYLLQYSPEHCVLYGACASLLELYKAAQSMGSKIAKRVYSFPVVDLYKAGQKWDETVVQLPEILHGKSMAIIATRHPNSILDIQKYLGETFPGLARVTLFEKALQGYTDEERHGPYAPPLKPGPAYASGPEGVQ
jgi:hypothetical protein